MAPGAAMPSAASRRTVVAVTIGNAIEFYDFLIYSLFAVQIGAALFPPLAGGGTLVASLAGFGIGFLARPLGALVIGRWSDRVGRKPAMVASVLLAGLANGALALVPEFAEIGWAATVLAVLCRLLAGFALGGELGCNSAFLAEAAAPGRRALTVSWQGASQSLGFLAAAAMAWALAEWMSPADFARSGWRIALASGVLAVPFALWLRSGLAEPQPRGAPDLVLAPLGERARVRLLAASSAILIASTVASYVLVYLPTYAQATLGLDPSIGFRATTVSVPLGAAAYLAGGWLADRRGRRPVLLLGPALVMLTAVPAFALMLGDLRGAGLMLGASLLAISQNFGMGALFAVLTEGLPRHWRGAGFGLIYAVTVGIFGGATQPLLAWALARWDTPWLPAWLLLLAGAVQLAAALLMPETAPARQRAGAASA